ncbi:hypothetical protein DV738_g3109, partial [Chaetothyriales sp. CBS 135597]
MRQRETLIIQRLRQGQTCRDNTDNPGDNGSAPSSSTSSTPPKAHYPPPEQATSSAASPASHNPRRPPPISVPKAAAPSLWDRAYDALRDNNLQPVDKYKKLLSHASNRGLDHINESVDKTNNQIDNTDPESHRRQLKTIINRGLRRIEETKTTYTIAGRQFILQKSAK